MGGSFWASSGGGGGGSATAVTAPLTTSGTANQVAKFTADRVIDDTLFITDSTNGVGFNRTLAAATHFVDIVAGALTSTQNALSVTGTLSSTAAIQKGVSVVVASAAAATGNQAMYISLTAGNTAAVNYVAVLENTAAGVGTSVTGSSANYGLYAYTYGLTVGTNAGVYGEALNGIVGIGLSGRAVTLKNNGTNIGVLGMGLNAGTTPIQIGGYFGLQSAAPTFTSAALMCDNGATTSPPFVARDNGTVSFQIVDTGNVLMAGATAVGTSGVGVFAIKSGTAPSTAPADTLQIFSEDISAGNACLSVFQEAAPYAGAGIASTTKIPVRYNGTTYYQLATTIA